MSSRDNDDFDSRMMRQIIGVSNESELRVEWTEAQLHSPAFTGASVSPPVFSSSHPSKSIHTTFSSLLDCPPELESHDNLPSSSTSPSPDDLGLGKIHEQWDDGSAPILLQGKRQRLRGSIEKYRLQLKHLWYGR